MCEALETGFLRDKDVEQTKDSTQNTMLACAVVLAVRNSSYE